MKTPITLSEKDRENIINYINKEPEYNIFIYGDLYNVGVCNDPVTTYAFMKGNDYDCILLKYFDNYVMYSDREDFDSAAVAEFLKGRETDCISGKYSVVEKLAPYFPSLKLSETYLSSCEKVIFNYSLPKDVTVKRLLPENAKDIVEMFKSIEGFAEGQADKETDRIEELAYGIEKNGDIGYGAFLNGEMISVAKTTAENDISAMVVGVATKKEYRKRGYASAMVAHVCEESLSLGKRFVCLFYDNPEAGKIYRKIGFKEIGKYAMLK